MGDQLCAIRTAYLFVEHAPEDVDRIIMSVSPGNEMGFLWSKFVETHDVRLVYDTFNPGDWNQRWQSWDAWRSMRVIDGIQFDHYRELYLRVHGCQRQTVLCGSERGLGRRNIYSYWWCGQENSPDELPQSVDWFDDTLVHHPILAKLRDVYISPHCKTQGNVTFTFDFWACVVRHLLNAGITVTVGYDGPMWDMYGFDEHPLYKKHWGDHEQWMTQVCSHKLVACGNTGTGWLAAACGVPMITMEPHGSCMADHRYRECGLKNIVEVVDGYKLDELGNDMCGVVADYVARRIREECRKCTVMTTGCYDILHSGHVRHLEKCRAMGTKLIVAMNSDQSVRSLKGTTRPINPQNQRKAVLEALRSVDEVRICDDPLDVVLEVRPNVLAVGYGYTREQIVGREFVESYGGSAVVTCYGDSRDEPSTTKIAQRMSLPRPVDFTEVIRAAMPYTVNPPEKLLLLVKQLLSVAELPGDVADLGTCRGGTGLLLRRSAPDRNLHLFDTWSGTPYDDPLCSHKQGEWKASLEDCCKVVGINNQTYYWNGVFPTDHHESFGQTLEDVRYCFVYVDMDTYQATKDAIMYFLDRMVVGGKMVFDDYGWEPCSGVKVAVDEAFAPSEFEVFQQQYTAVVTKR